MSEVNSNKGEEKSSSFTRSYPPIIDEYSLDLSKLVSISIEFAITGELVLWYPPESNMTIGTLYYYNAYLNMSSSLS